MAILSLPASTEKLDKVIKLILVKCVLKASTILYLSFISLLSTLRKSGADANVDPVDDFISFQNLWTIKNVIYHAKIILTFCSFYNFSKCIT